VVLLLESCDESQGYLRAFDHLMQTRRQEGAPDSSVTPTTGGGGVGLRGGGVPAEVFDRQVQLPLRGGGGGAGGGGGGVEEGEEGGGGKEGERVGCGGDWRKVGIQVNVVRRLLKDVCVCGQEHTLQMTRVSNLRSAAADVHDVKQQEKVLQEAETSIADTRSRLRDGVNDLLNTLQHLEAQERDVC
jgi:hypothetical protein